jgi:hypothetical protein
MSFGVNLLPAVDGSMVGVDADLPGDAAVW